jgi:transcriptional regulator with XRE-family HTH domain
MRKIKTGKWKQPGNPGLGIRVRRIVCQLNQSELAQRSGVHQSRISLLENGYTRPSARERRLLATVLGCNEGDLLSGKG